MGGVTGGGRWWPGVPQTCCNKTPKSRYLKHFLIHSEFNVILIARSPFVGPREPPGAAGAEDRYFHFFISQIIHLLRISPFPGPGPWPELGLDILPLEALEPPEIMCGATILDHISGPGRRQGRIFLILDIFLILTFLFFNFPIFGRPAGCLAWPAPGADIINSFSFISLFIVFNFNFDFGYF